MSIITSSVGIAALVADIAMLTIVFKFRILHAKVTIRRFLTLLSWHCTSLRFDRLDTPDLMPLA